MSLCPYRFPPRTHPGRPRCALDEGHRGEHVPREDAPRGRIPTATEETALVRLPVSVRDAWTAASEAVRTRALAAFVRALRR